MQNANRPNLTQRMKNTSYIFVPFSYNINFDKSIVENFWREKKQGNKYFLKYIVEKLSHDSNNVCCRPYLMDDNLRNNLGIVSPSDFCYIDTSKYVIGDKPFSFYIREILLFLFETNIGFIIYKIEHGTEDTSDIIASKNYHLKKIHTTLLYTEKDDGTKATLVLGSATINSLSLLTEYILDKTLEEETDVFFNYSSAEERRSNILTHYNLQLDHALSEQDNSRIEDILFHLKRNYHHEWKLDGMTVYNEAEYFKASSHIRWGITSEATICLTITDPHTYFVGNSFYDNFHSYYFYLYILSLHQKYALYYYLTNFSTERSVDGLEKNLQELADFKAKYVFKIISESQTYQTVYSIQCKSFGLDKLYSDINEQITRVMNVKKTLNEKKKNQQEARINWILGLIAFLGFFSAFVDMNVLIGGLTWLFSVRQISIIQKVATFILFVISIIFVVTFLRASRKKNE